MGMHWVDGECFRVLENNSDILIRNLLQRRSINLIIHCQFNTLETMKSFKFIAFFLSYFLIVGILSCSLFNDFRCFEFHNDLTKKNSASHPEMVQADAAVELSETSHSSIPHEHRCAIRNGFNSVVERKSNNDHFQKVASHTPTSILYTPLTNFYKNVLVFKNHLHNNFALYLLKLCKNSVVLLF